jgi:hypothetical protein
MRLTNLNFKPPTETHPEYRMVRVNYTGTNMDYNKTMSHKFAQDARFKEMPLYDKKTGMSVFLGPGSYNPHISQDGLNK